LPACAWPSTAGGTSGLSSWTRRASSFRTGRRRAPNSVRLPMASAAREAHAPPPPSEPGPVPPVFRRVPSP
jgi:hypothetical protein